MKDKGIGGVKVRGGEKERNGKVRREKRTILIFNGNDNDRRRTYDCSKEVYGHKVNPRMYSICKYSIC